MKILHIASFNGNIGDNANHSGFRKFIGDILGTTIEWEMLEIRNFYKSWGIQKFDDNFVKHANLFDLVVIGGGNFFEICHEYSNTGCTIDLSDDILQKISTPIFFHGLGFDTNKGYSDITKKRFNNFISTLCDSDKYFISFRNDGSDTNYIKLYGSLSKEIHIVPDGAFNYLIPKSRINDSSRVLGINAVMDMHEIRFKNKSYEEVITEFSLLIKDLVESLTYGKILFFPHIISDVKIIYDIITQLPDPIIKHNIEICPYITGQGSEDLFFSNYTRCDEIIGFRFHSNLCAINNLIPIIGINSYSKINDLYNELDLTDFLVDINEKDLSTKLKEKLSLLRLERSVVIDKYNKSKLKLEKKYSSYPEELKEWLLRNNLLNENI